MSLAKIWNLFVVVLLLVGLVGCSSRPKMVPLRDNNDDEEEEQQDEPEAAAPAEGESSGSETVEEAPPAIIQLTPLERQQQSLANMQQIAKALTDYAKEKGRYPTVGLRNAEEDMTVSWRVELLPYLGYGALYRRFDLQRQWNDPSNKKLLSEIPDCYRIPGRTDDKCPYRLLTGKTSCVTGGPDAITLPSIAAGIDRTLLLVEVNDQFAGAWSEPEVLPPKMLKTYTVALYAGFLAMWADGRIGMVPNGVNPSALNAALSIYGQKSAPNLWDLCAPLSPALMEFKSSGDGGSVTVDPLASGEGQPEGEEGTTNPEGSSGSTAATNLPPNRAAEPTAAEQREAMVLVKELFLDRFQAATTNAEKQEVAREMVQESSKLETDLAGKYVMLSTAQRIAMEANDLETAQKAIQGLTAVFDVDEFNLRVNLLKKTETITQRSGNDSRIVEESRGLMVEAVQRDDFASAIAVANVALAAARRINAKDDVIDLTQWRRDIDKVHASYREVRAAIERVGDVAEDPVVSEAAGRYYALMKGEWEKGLVHFARGDNADLRRLAQMELESPSEAEKQLVLADGWFALIEGCRSQEEVQLRRRALHWYQLAAANLPPALPKLKAELRVKELRTSLEVGKPDRNIFD